MLGLIIFLVFARLSKNATPMNYEGYLYLYKQTVLTMKAKFLKTNFFLTLPEKLFQMLLGQCLSSR